MQLEQSTAPGLTLQDKNIKLLLVLLSSTQQGLQQHLDLLENYWQNWALAVNLKKTNIMVFQKKPSCQEHRYQFSLPVQHRPRTHDAVHLPRPDHHCIGEFQYGIECFQSLSSKSSIRNQEKYWKSKILKYRFQFGVKSLIVFDTEPRKESTQSAGSETY